MIARRIRKGDLCEYGTGSCHEPAVDIAHDRKRNSLGVYCNAHARLVAYDGPDAGHPEYKEQCPNCGCMFGTN